MPPCVFCGSNEPLSAEHVYPQWCQPLLTDPSGESGTHRSTTLRLGQRPKVRSYKGQPATQTVRAVCKGCNSGWMSRLEQQAKPLLAAMIEGRPQILTPDAQAAVSSWFVKTGLVAGSKFKPALVPDFYEQFRCDLRPSAATRVWLAEVAYREHHYVDFRPIRVHKEGGHPPLIPNAWSAVLGVGEVAGVVVSWLDAKPSLRELLRRFAPGLVAIWPTRSGDVVWPPSGGCLDHDGLDALADAVVRMDDVQAGRGRPNI